MSVCHFHHVALSVPDVAVQKKFYEDFGLVGTDQTTAQRAKAVACLDPFDLFRVTALVLPMAMAMLGASRLFSRCRRGRIPSRFAAFFLVTREGSWAKSRLVADASRHRRLLGAPSPFPTSEMTKVAVASWSAMQ